MGRKAFLVVMLAGLIPGIAGAQDAQYWTQQYGTRSTLLGGMVVGTVQDLSATYYNPGALALIANPDFIMSANIAQWERVKLTSTTNDTPNRDDGIGSNRVDFAPDMFAGMINVDVLGARRLAYSVLVRQRFNFDIASRFVGVLNISEDPTVETASEITLQQNLTETWVGLTWSTQTDEESGFGITPYLAIRSQRTRNYLSLTSLNEENVNSGIQTHEFGYTNFRALIKAGYTTKLGGFGVGLTATSPSLHVWGQGDVYLQTSGTGFPGFPQILAAAHHEKQRAEYRSPPSVALGAGYTHGKGTLHTSFEYFFGVPEYHVMAPPVSQGQTDGLPLTLDLIHSTEGVLNWGLAGEYQFTPSLKMFTSVIRDHSTDAGSGGQESQRVSVSTWDLTHLSLGGSFKVGKVDLILGGAAALGRKTRAEIREIEPLPDTELEVQYQHYRLQFGFTAEI